MFLQMRDIVCNRFFNTHMYSFESYCFGTCIMVLTHNLVCNKHYERCHTHLPSLALSHVSFKFHNWLCELEKQA